MKKCYKAKKFMPPTMVIIDQANEIIEEYQKQGLNLTLRQLYYQFVARDLFPNVQKNYQKLSIIISEARLAGLVDWNAIIDRTRDYKSLAHWDSPAEIVDACAEQYRVWKWANQPTVVEVWIEKEALIGVVEEPCNKLDVGYFACKGYNSQSEMWAAAMRLKGYIDNGQQVKIIHLGDHDPSGIDMTRDILERINMFLDNDLNFDLVRLGLNHDQIKKYNPPPNPTKFKDPRASDYIKNYGRKSWELDALEPKVMRDLITKEINKTRDLKMWKIKEMEQTLGRFKLRETATDMKMDEFEFDDDDDEGYEPE